MGIEILIHNFFTIKKKTYNSNFEVSYLSFFLFSFNPEKNVFKRVPNESHCNEQFNNNDLIVKI